MTEPQTAYITQYALIRGILKVTGTVVDGEVLEVPSASGICCFYYHKPYWHNTLADAELAACAIRDKRIRSLRKTLARLESLTFGD